MIKAFTILILQSDNLIDLVKDYTAIFFITEIDDCVFPLAQNGYLGPVLKRSVENAMSDGNTSLRDASEHPIRSIGFMTILSGTFEILIFMASNQMDGEW